MAAISTIGFVGLGHMGMGMARNLLSKGFAVRGHARRAAVVEEFKVHGGTPVNSPAKAADGATAVFLMVLDQAQAIDVLDRGGLLDALAPGSALIVTATLGSGAVCEIAERLIPRGVDLIDAPVSGGQAGADQGTLTLMVSAPNDVLARHNNALRAVGTTLIQVGTEPGVGQVAKTCLQTLIGVSFEGLFEAMVLGRKAGLDAAVLSQVINASFVGSRLTQATTAHIVARRFQGTGSHVGTMHKDIALGLQLAHQLGATLPAAAAAMQMFQAAKTTNPDGDNTSVLPVLEALAGIGHLDAAPLPSH